MTTTPTDSPAEAAAKPGPKIIPFWERLPEIAMYPAHKSALSMIGILAVCHLVSYLPFGNLLDLVVWVTMYKFAFECLRETANGRFEPPEFAVAVDDSLGWKSIALQFVLGAAVLFAFWAIGPITGLIVLFVLAVASPAAIMSLAMDENLGIALNPAMWWAVLTRIGWPYVALVALYFGFGLIYGIAGALLESVLPGFIALVVVSALAQYVMIAAFHMMGYLIYQSHADIGYTPTAKEAPIERGRADPQQGVLDEAERLVQKGRSEAACDLLGVEVRGRGGSETVRARYQKLLAQLERREEQLHHGREWITTLLAQGNERRAVDVARECLAVDPKAEVVGPDDVARVARKAAAIGATPLALSLITSLRGKYPEHADVPGCELLAAKLLAERLGRDAEARAMLADISKNYPNSSVAAEAFAYRNLLNQIAVRGQSGPPRTPGASGGATS